MEKIKTIFDRDWDGNRGCINRYISPAIPQLLLESIATEKLDGTNVRLTIRNHTLVRLEKRRNPTKIEKHKGVENPWYVDAYENSHEDQYIWEAARNTDIYSLEDGEYSAEALGEKIQGNPLKLSGHICCVFSAGKAPQLNDVPIGFDDLMEYIKNKDSLFGDGKIEGVVWHHPSGIMFKIKSKDFK